VEQELGAGRVVVAVHDDDVLVASVHVVDGLRVRRNDEVVVLGGNEESRNEAVRRVRDGRDVLDLRRERKHEDGNIYNKRGREIREGIEGEL